MYGEVSRGAGAARLTREEQDRRVGGVIWGHMPVEVGAGFAAPLPISAVAINDDWMLIQREGCGSRRGFWMQINSR